MAPVTLTSNKFKNTITPMLSYKNAASAIEFYKKAFGAIEITRQTDTMGRMTHAEIRIGNVSIMLSDEFPEIGVFSPETVGGSPVMLLLQVEDVDRFFNKAIAAGARLARPVAGNSLRNGKLVDPFGHRWMILTRNGNG